jgi:uncharacterized RDD family membrane protein YckC
MATGAQPPSGDYGVPSLVHTERHPAAHREPGSDPRATFAERVSAAALDLLIVGIPAGIVYSVLEGSLTVSFGGGGDGGAIGGGEGVGRGAMAVFILAAAAATLVYSTCYEGSAPGQTIGKRAVGIRVLRHDGAQPLGFKRAALRYFARVLSLLPFLLGFLWMLWDKDKKTWHDKLSRSVVVPTWAYPVE